MNNIIKSENVRMVDKDIDTRKQQVNRLLNEIIQAARADITDGLKSSDNYYTRAIERIYKEDAWR